MAELVQFKFAMVDLELIVSGAKEVMESCIKKIRKGKRTEEIGDFDGYWKSVYNMVKEKLGDEKAKELQKEIIIHYYNLTKDKGFEARLKYSIGFDISESRYKKIIEKFKTK